MLKLSLDAKHSKGRYSSHQSLDAHDLFNNFQQQENQQESAIALPKAIECYIYIYIHKLSAE